ncbi:MAG: hypothetical protein BJ554DRAFT_2484, partial [Olpidium bornovanus]
QGRPLCPEHAPAPCALRHRQSAAQSRRGSPTNSSSRCDQEKLRPQRCQLVAANPPSAPGFAVGKPFSASARQPPAKRTAYLANQESQRRTRRLRRRRLPRSAADSPRSRVRKRLNEGIGKTAPPAAVAAVLRDDVFNVLLNEDSPARLKTRAPE